MAMENFVEYQMLLLVNLKEQDFIMGKFAVQGFQWSQNLCSL